MDPRLDELIDKLLEMSGELGGSFVPPPSNVDIQTYLDAYRKECRKLGTIEGLHMAIEAAEKINGQAKRTD